MENWMKILGIVFVIAIIFVVWWISASNGFKRKSIKINESLSGIEVALLKRYDLLTKLRDTAKSYITHEKDLFTHVVELRQGMSIQELNEKSALMDAMNARISAVAENYPQLRSADVFTQLQAGIRDAEEHLQAARRLYNSNVSAYNTAIDLFPSSLVAKSQKLTKQEFFSVEAKKQEDINMNL